MLPNQTSIKSYHVYAYTFLDDLSYVKEPYDQFADEEKYKIDDAIRLIGERFREYGWEGDGRIGIVWIPPFLDIGVEDTWGTYVWHVKQRNNGISFLASDVPLDSKRLQDQLDVTSRSSTRNLIPISIIETDVQLFLKSIQEVKAEYASSLQLLLQMPSDEIKEKIIRNLTLYYQSLAVRYFQDFLDECYLRILIETIQDGNPHKIKLRKSQIKLDYASYLPEDEDVDDEGATWFTIRGFIRDMWIAYKWEPFKNRTDMLFKSTDYVIDPALFDEIKKHVIIRNCMQHHEGRLDRDSLYQLGKDRIPMKKDGGVYYIDAWKPITIFDEELYSLFVILERFADDFHKHIKRRVPTIHYMSKKTQPVAAPDRQDTAPASR
jgi:hypothetical protein